MTATNVDVVTTVPIKYRSREQYPCSAPFGAWITHGVVANGPSRWVRDYRPNNTTNPVREDGTRAPAPWDRIVGDLTVVRNDYSVLFERVTPFCQRIEYELVGEKLVVPSDLRSFLAKIHGSWLFGSGPFPGSIEGKARTAFLSKLADGQVEFGTMLGEMNQTLGLIQDFADRSAKAVRKIRRMGRNLPVVILREIVHFGRIPPKRSLPKWYQGKRRLALERAILREWLTFQFGIKPLVLGVADLVLAIDSLIAEKAVPNMWIRAGAAGRETYEYRGYDAVVVGPNSGSLRMHGVGHTNYACHIVGRYELSDYFLRTSQQWGVVNPAALAWELTPFSWMIDYLWNVSRWLNSFTASMGLRFVEGSIGRLAKLDHNTCRVPVSGGLYTRTMAYDDPLTAGAFIRFQRQVLTHGVFPDIMPRWQPRLNATRVANALSALVLQIRLT